MRKRDIKRCYYCGARTQVCKVKGKEQKVIFHADFCKPAHDYLKDKGKYRIEVEVPDVEHGGYASADIFGI